MKRKSILMTIVTLLFAGVVMAQTPQWSPALPTANVVDKDTIYFCARTDSLYPIELGYDVAGKSLRPAYGEWTLISKTSGIFAVADYNLGVPNGNGGAGNAYKVVTQGIGGLVFQYEAKDAQCQLNVGDKFLIYVFVLPDYQDVLTAKDTIVCYTANTPGTQPIDLKETFKTEFQLYTDAGLEVEWKSGAVHNVRKDSIATYLFRDTIHVKTAPSKYTCGTDIPVSFKVRVDTIGQLHPLSLGICAVDTLGDLGQRNPNEIFKRNVAGGYYDPATINNWSVADTTAHKKIFTYHYTDCDLSPKTVVDTLYLLKYRSDSYWGEDTVTYCRDSATMSVFTLYYDDEIDYPNIGQGKPDLTLTKSYWFDRGASGSAYGPADYGTLNTYTSLDGTTVDIDNLKSSIGYHYLWRPDPAAYPCLVNPNTGKIDSGTIVLIIRDYSYAQDYTAQLCNKSYGNFNLNEYTLLGVKWYYLGTEVSGGIVDINSTAKGTYKYTYNLPADCGPGGDGVFYLKVGDKVKVSGSKEVKFCVNKLPAAINVNDLLNVASGLTWTVAAGNQTAADAAFNTSTGILDITKYAAGLGGVVSAGTDDLTFSVSSGDQCGVSTNTTVKVSFVTSLN